MSAPQRQFDNPIFRQVVDTLNSYPELIRQIPVDTMLHRVQPSRYDASPINYRADADTRYADPAKQVGVYYLGFTDATHHKVRDIVQAKGTGA